MKDGSLQGAKFGAKLASVFFSFVLAFSMIPTAPAVADAGSGQESGGGLLAASFEGAAEGGSQLTGGAHDSDAEGASGVQALSVSPSADAASGVTYWDDKIDLDWYVGHESDTSYEIGTAAQLAGLAYLTSPLSRTADEYNAWATGASKLSAASANAKYSTVEVADFADKTVKLTADIDMQGSESRVTKPIADINNLTPGAGGQGGSGGTLSNVAWKGTFDGQGHTVSNVYIDWRSLITANYGGYQGMFSAVADGAVIQKVGVTGTIYGRVIGGIAAVSRFSGNQKAVETYPLIQNSWTNVTTAGNGSGSRPTGGIFGGESERSDWCNIVNCYAKGIAHNGQSGGGIAGFLNGTIAGCYASGKVTAPNNTGAIVATLYKPGSETGSITSANGFYGTNAAIEGVDPNGNAYRYLDGTGSNPIEVKTGLTKVSDIQGEYYYKYLHNTGLRRATSAEGYAQATEKVNDGYPLLYWQADPEAAEVDLSSATVEVISDQTYTSKPIEPALTVKLGSTTLYQGNDFIAKWENNVNVSTEQSKAKVTLYGVGRYTGHTQATEFNITKMDISGTTATLQAEHFWRYGEPVMPAVTVKKGNNTLVKGRDYDLKYENNDAAGTGKVSVVSLKDADGNDLQIGTGPALEYYITDASASLTGSGTASYPYQLKDRKDLQFLAHQVDLQNEDYLGKCYQVVSDIDCTPGENEAYNQTIGYFVSITSIKPFRGTFDGNGKTIKLAIDQESRWATAATQATYNSADSALFGAVGFPASASADYSDVTTIKNLTLSGTVNGKGSRTAAFVGYHAYNSLSIEKCVNEAPITSASASAGFIAQTQGAVSVKDSTNKGAITISGNGNAAGFLQSSSTAATVPGGIEFIGCRNEGNITTAGAYTAGIVATGSPNAALSIVRCSNSGDITSTNTSTARSGSMLATATGGSNLVVIDSCYNTGNITYANSPGNNSVIGGIVGESGSAAGTNFVSVVNCYNTGTVAEGGTSRPNMFVGGLAGKVCSTANNAAAGPTFVTGYDTGSVTVSSTNSPGFAAGAHSAALKGTSEDTHAAVTVKALGLDTLNLDAVGWEQYSDRYPKVIDESKKVTSDQLKGAGSFMHGDASTTALDYLGSAFVADSADNPVNGGYPILYWQTGEGAYDISKATAEPIPAQQATGSALMPAVELSYDGKDLVSGMDYTVKYSDNTNAGTATATVIGLGRFGGSSKTLTFKIDGISLTSKNTAVTGLIDAVYTGDEITQTPTVTYTPEGGSPKKLTANTHYTVDYAKNLNAGTANIYIEGAGVYEGTVKATFEITPAPFADVVIEGVEPVYEDTGSPAAIAPTLTNAAGNAMTANVDYTWQIVDKNGQESTAGSAGNYTAVFAPKSGNYAGNSRSVEFDVGTYLTVYRQVGLNGTPQVAKTYTHAAFANLKSETSQDNPVSGMYYKGGAWMVTSSDNYVLLDDLIADAGLEADWKDGASISYGGDPLQGKQTQVFDYTTFKGMNKFFPKTSGAAFDEEGAIDAPAVLTLTEHSSTSSSTLSCGNVQEANLADANRANEPRLIYGVNLADMKADSSTWGGETTRGMRYWSSNEQVTIIVPGIDISGATVEGASDATYTGGAIEPSVKVKLDGEYLDETAYSVSYENNTNAGDATVIVTGNGSYEGTATAAFKISPASIASAAVTLSKTSFTYSGAVQKPTVKSVKLVSKTLGAGDYAASYSNASSKNAGTYKVTVKGKGNYTGTVSKAASYRIAQASQSLSATGKTASYKASALKKKAATLKRASSVTLKGAKTTVTYKLIGVKAAKYKKYFSVASKSGDIMLKKGLPKGTYKLSVSATASKTANYKSASKSYTVTVKVK